MIYQWSSACDLQLLEQRAVHPVGFTHHVSHAPTKDPPAFPPNNCSTWRLQACQIDTRQETSNEKIERDTATKYVPMGLPQGPTFLRFRSRLGKLSHKKKLSNPASIMHVEAYSSAQLLVLLRSCQSRSKASEVCNLPKAWRAAAALMVVR